MSDGQPPRKQPRHGDATPVALLQEHLAKAKPDPRKTAHLVSYAIGTLDACRARFHPGLQVAGELGLLVGKSEKMTQLVDFVEKATEKTVMVARRALYVSGPAGTGKTTAVEHAIALTRARRVGEFEVASISGARLSKPEEVWLEVCSALQRCTQTHYRKGHPDPRFKLERKSVAEARRVVMRMVDMHQQHKGDPSQSLLAKPLLVVIDEMDRIVQRRSGSGQVHGSHSFLFDLLDITWRAPGKVILICISNAEDHLDHVLKHEADRLKSRLEKVQRLTFSEFRVEELREILAARAASIHYVAKPLGRKASLVARGADDVVDAPVLSALVHAVCRYTGGDCRRILSAAVQLVTLKLARLPAVLQSCADDPEGCSTAGLNAAAQVALAHSAFTLGKADVDQIRESIAGTAALYSGMTKRQALGLAAFLVSATKMDSGGRESRRAQVAEQLVLLTGQLPPQTLDPIRRSFAPVLGYDGEDVGLEMARVALPWCTSALDETALAYMTLDSLEASRVFVRPGGAKSATHIALPHASGVHDAGGALSTVHELAAFLKAEHSDVAKLPAVVDAIQRVHSGTVPQVVELAGDSESDAPVTRP
eukprot:TRINITY_DN25676_c0_g1_i1.p1 TRINITY_DN25676_c0_g1~~TRINITY_DN25676_c0_g1_i1.p1  ORF type:complete len:595 (+),score=138.86 TRINITY_DN25676_c0_g1_i1:69-1853(+)